MTCGEIVGGNEEVITVMSHFIERRRRRWYAVLDVPADVRHVIKRRRYIQTLQTESEIVARDRATHLVRRWKAEIKKARGGADAMDPFEATAAWYRQAVLEIRAEHADDEDDEAEQTVLGVLIDSLEDMERKHPGKGVEVWKRATGETVGTVEHLEEWLATVNNEIKSIDLKRADVRRLARKFPTINEIRRKEIRRWHDDLVQNEGLKAASVRRLLSSCRMYWRYLQSVEVVPDKDGPFDNLHLPKITTGRNKDEKVQPWEPVDLVRILEAAVDKGDRKADQLADFIRLSMWTGARAEELCSLKVEDVSLAEDYFDISSAKTPAGVRQVPIHANLRGTIEHLCKDSTDGYVLPGLTTNPQGDRRNRMTQRFSNLKTAMGFVGRLQVCHSIRHTVYRLLETAGVPLHVIGDIVGHSGGRSAMSWTYGGSTLDTKRTALALLVYPTDA